MLLLGHSASTNFGTDAAMTDASSLLKPALEAALREAAKHVGRAKAQRQRKQPAAQQPKQQPAGQQPKQRRQARQQKPAKLKQEQVEQEQVKQESKLCACSPASSPASSPEDAGAAGAAGGSDCTHLPAHQQEWVASAAARWAVAAFTRGQAAPVPLGAANLQPLQHWGAQSGPATLAYGSSGFPVASDCLPVRSQPHQMALPHALLTAFAPLTARAVAPVGCASAGLPLAMAGDLLGSSSAAQQPMLSMQPAACNRQLPPSQWLTAQPGHPAAGPAAASLPPWWCPVQQVSDSSGAAVSRGAVPPPADLSCWQHLLPLHLQGQLAAPPAGCAFDDGGDDDDLDRLLASEFPSW